MRHTLSILVENKFGVLTRVAGLFSGRGYNIDTLNVAPTRSRPLKRGLDGLQFAHVARSTVP